MGKKQTFWAMTGLIVSTSMGCGTILDIDQEFIQSDQRTDPENCGSWGHNCQGGTCLEGTCQPVIFADMQDGANYIAVDATNVYWTNRYGGQVMKMAIDGGSPIAIATGQKEPRCIVVDKPSVYWTNVGAGTVMMVGIDGSNLTTLAAGQNNPYDIVVNDEFIFWTNEGTFSPMPPFDGSLMKLKHGEAVATPLVTNVNYPQAIAVVDATSVYWTDADNLTKTGLDGVMRIDLAPLPVSPDLNTQFSRIAVNKTSVFWTNTDNNTVNKVGITGSKPDQLAATSQTPFGIAVDAMSVYWTSSFDHTVTKVGIEGGTATTLATDQPFPVGIAVDETCIYWANRDNGTVMKLAK